MEVCPLSNQLLNYTKNIQTNQGNLLLKSGVDITINSDDPTMFQNTQVDDFFYAILSWNINLQSLYRIIANNITHAADLNQTSKTIIHANLQLQWAAFIKAL